MRHEKAVFLFPRYGIEETPRVPLFHFCDIVFDDLPKVYRKGKDEVFQNFRVSVHRLGFL